MSTWWQALAARQRITLGVCAAALLALSATAGWWLLRVEHAVLFSELRPQDAATMTAELEKLKVPYALADGGATVLVERAQVHAVRLKLMGRELPLHGTVGLELFNHTDFGMTEFAQKINYQRALQGELTRTILSFPEVRDARVHLALPEQGLFRQNASRPKAAITLHMKQGLTLRPAQVNGIQRLVAAAVPGLVAQEVTLVDQHGTALSRAADDADAATGSSRLELKRDLENYLSRKVGLVLEQAFGPGQALASVDVTLNMDQMRVTTEDVLAAPDSRGGSATGVLVRERESARDGAVPETGGSEPRPGRGSSMQRDAEYQAGRRVEQVVSQPGAIRRLQVVAVVRQALGEARRSELQQLVAAAAGASLERGDAVVIQVHDPAAAKDAAPMPPAPATAAVPQSSPPSAGALAPVLAGGLLILLALAWVRQRRRPRFVGAHRLSDAQRHAELQRVQSWLLESPPLHDGAQAPSGGNP